MTCHFQGAKIIHVNSTTFTIAEKLQVALAFQLSFSLELLSCSQINPFEEICWPYHLDFNTPFSTRYLAIL